MAGHMPVNVMFRPLDKHKGRKVSTNYSSPTPEFLGAPVCGNAGKQTGKHQQVTPVIWPTELQMYLLNGKMCCPN